MSTDDPQASPSPDRGADLPVQEEVDSGVYELADDEESIEASSTPEPEVSSKDDQQSDGSAKLKKQEPPPRPRARATPEGRTPRRTWLEVLVLIGLLSTASVLFLLRLDDRGATQDEQREADRAWAMLQASRQTVAVSGRFDLRWLDLSGSEGQRHETAPGHVWVQAAALAMWVKVQQASVAAGVESADEQTADESALTPDAHERVVVLRLASVGAMLIVLAAAYWATLSLGGQLPAVLAGLVFIAMPGSVWFARAGTGEAITLAWVILSVASMLWAMRPLRPAGGALRQALGWAVAGVALGATLLCGGVSASAAVLVPVVLILVLVPRRLGHVMGLVATVCVAVLLCMPWVIHSIDHGTSSWWHWLWPGKPGETWEMAGLTDPSVIVFGLLSLGPWLLWIFAMLMQPTSASAVVRGARRRLILGWVWWVAALAGMIVLIGSAAGAWQLSLAPASAVMVGLLMGHFHDLSTQGRHARLWRWSRWPMALLILLGSVALPALAHAQGQLVEAELLSMPLLADMHATYWALTGAVLMVLALAGARFAYSHYVARATGMWAAWCVVAMLSVIWPLADTPPINAPQVAAAPTTDLQP